MIIPKIWHTLISALSLLMCCIGKNLNKQQQCSTCWKQCGHSVLSRWVIMDGIISFQTLCFCNTSPNIIHCKSLCIIIHVQNVLFCAYCAYCVGGKTAEFVVQGLLLCKVYSIKLSIYHTGRCVHCVFCLYCRLVYLSIYLYIYPSITSELNINKSGRYRQGGYRH